MFGYGKFHQEDLILMALDNPWFGMQERKGHKIFYNV